MCLIKRCEKKNSKSYTLVLNKLWYPINLVPSIRGICMVFEGTAHAIDDFYAQHDFESWINNQEIDENEHYIQSSSCRIKIPKAIVLNRYDKIPKTKVRLSKANIYKRDGFICQYCGLQTSRARLTIDHIYPKSKGGETSWMNCVASCVTCNTKKADKMLEKSGLKLIRKPFEPEGRHITNFHFEQHKIPDWENFMTSSI